MDATADHDDVGGSPHSRTTAATARDLAARGARLALIGLEPEKLAALSAELGAGHVWAEADVTDSAALQAAGATYLFNSIEEMMQRLTLTK